MPNLITHTLKSWTCGFGLLTSAAFGLQHAAAEPSSPSDLNTSQAQPFLSEVQLYEHLQSKRFFDFELDRDLNRFPDDWFIEKSPDFESYHKLVLDPNQGAGNSRNSLKFDFSGGKAGVSSAPLILEKRFAYNITLKYKSEGLDKNFDQKIILGLRSYDKGQKLLKTDSISTQQFNDTWQASPLLRVESLPPETASCTLFIHLEGRPSGLGKLWVDHVDIESSPRIRFHTGQNLNTFAKDQALVFEHNVEGTKNGERYQFVSQVKDFMGNPIGGESNKELKGQKEAIQLKQEIPNAQAGVYYISSKLLLNDKVLVRGKEIIAKNSLSGTSFSNPAFGVLVGHPSGPFEPLMDSMQLLGASVSKLDLFPNQVSFEQIIRDRGIKGLNPLLRKLAPDLGYKFIAVLNTFPTESIKDPYKPPKHLVDTFANYPKTWTDTLDEIALQYGNVFSDWQLGPDSETVSSEGLKEGEEVVAHLKDKTEWMKLYQPNRLEEMTTLAQGFNKNIYISADMTDAEIEEKIKSENLNNIDVTLALNSSEELSQLEIIENLVRRITILKSSKSKSGEALVSRLFIDRLTGKETGLMTASYKPHSSYFAARTMIYWMDGANFIGQFQNPDHDVQHYVFTRGQQAFVILWRTSKSGKRAPTKAVKYYLGREVRSMDLMGNTKDTTLDSESGFEIEVGPTPIFLTTPFPKLWKTILSTSLTKSDIKAKIQFQDQNLKVDNAFDEQVKMELSFEYPQGFELQKDLYSSEISPGETYQMDLSLSPSPQFPLNRPVPVYVDMNINFPNMHHHVKVYREDQLNSEVELSATFFKEAQGLKMGVNLNLSNSAQKPSTFIVSALLPNGNTLETLFKGVQPGERRQNSLFILNGEKFIDQEMTLTARENIGQRYLNAQFTITPSY